MKFIAILACIFTGATLVAQSNDNFSIGPKVGLILSDISAEGTKIKPGLAIGLTSTYSIRESSGIGLDILYSQMGYKVGNTNVDINYIKLPLMYKFFFNKWGDSFRPKFELGISPGFLVSANTNGVNRKDIYNSFDIGIIGGIGFNYRLASRIWLNAEIRADLGLTEIRKNPTSESFKNRPTSINLGVAYGI